MADITQLVNQANQFFARKKYKQAQKHYEQALKLAPENAILNFNLGVVYQVQNQDKKAISFYERALNSADAKNNLGIIFKRQGDIKKAEEYYETALKINPKHQDAQENLKLLQSEKVTEKIIASSKPKQTREESLITVDKIPKHEVETIRDSFSYQGLAKALDSKIITLNDIKAEATWEQKNKDLLMDQRVHTVLLTDIENKQVKNLSADLSHEAQRAKGEAPSVGAETGKPIPLKREKIQDEDNKEPVQELEKSIGCKITNGWKGLDKAGNFINIIAIEDSGWVKFRTFDKSQKTQCLNYPLTKFINYFKEAKIFEIDPDDFDLVIPEKLSKLNREQKTDLIKKIHARTMSKLKNLKTKKRNLLEKILRRREDKQLTEILARIKA